MPLGKYGDHIRDGITDCVDAHVKCTCFRLYLFCFLRRQQPTMVVRRNTSNVFTMYCVVTRTNTEINVIVIIVM